MFFILFSSNCISHASLSIDLKRIYWLKDSKLINLLLIVYFLFHAILLLVNLDLRLRKIRPLDRHLLLVRLVIVLLIPIDLIPQFLPLPLLVMLLLQILVNYCLIRFLRSKGYAAAHGRPALLSRHLPFLFVLLYLLLQHCFDQGPTLRIFHIFQFLELARLIHVGVELVHILLILLLLFLQPLFESCPRLRHR